MKHITKLVVAFAVASLLLVGPAAATCGHQRKPSSKLSANNTHVQKGSKVTFTDRAQCNWKKC